MTQMPLLRPGTIKQHKNQCNIHVPHGFTESNED